MLIRDVEQKFPAFHKPAGEAAYLISTGKFEKCEAPLTPKTYPEMKWAVRDGDPVDDMAYPPSIFYSCGACGNPGRISGPSATAQIIRHCGVAESVPEHIAAEYTKRRAAYLKRYPVKPKVAAPAPKRDSNGNVIFTDTRSAADKAFDQGAAAHYGAIEAAQLAAIARKA